MSNPYPVGYPYNNNNNSSGATAAYPLPPPPTAPPLEEPAQYGQRLGRVASDPPVEYYGPGTATPANYRVVHSDEDSARYESPQYMDSRVPPVYGSRAVRARPQYVYEDTLQERPVYVVSRTPQYDSASSSSSSGSGMGMGMGMGAGLLGGMLGGMMLGGSRYGYGGGYYGCGRPGFGLGIGPGLGFGFGGGHHHHGGWGGGFCGPHGYHHHHHHF
eukprot:ANDGO_02954.mRNA.1 hypothetical protein